MTDRDVFARDWQVWQERRWRDVAGPHGIAALAATHWLGAAEQRLEGIPGRWRAEGAAAIGAGLLEADPMGAAVTRLDGTAVEDEVLLVGGDELRLGVGQGAAQLPRNHEDARLRIFVREGVPALRRIDPAAEGRTSLRRIDAHEPDPAWVVEAQWTAGGTALGADTLEIEQVDGHRTRRSDVGSLAFELDGRELRLTTTGGIDADGNPALAVVFTDATSGDGSYRFRFLRLPLPDASGAVTIDFNRAFLPPCAFSDHYVCPMPSPENRLDISIRAGERMPVLHSAGAAAAAGQSLQEYLRAKLEAESARPTLEDVLARAGGRAGGSLSFSEAVELVRGDRDHR
ncbi:DUF1684 domain-containing protein [Agrococcus sp. KRD186]|uniref:DUF1684 domain-containing protein n=1 Tax=Agrococcus sp. KRD186 TaxID=2729730 RepID=UPI0019D25B2D|nr:DUF1684 domain-containing protein [Agrococcus sp. KRD186]